MNDLNRLTEKNNRLTERILAHRQQVAHLKTKRRKVRHQITKILRELTRSCD